MNAVVRYLNGIDRKAVARGLSLIAAIDLLYLFVSGAGANYRRLATLSAVDGILVLSLVVLTGMVGQISFVQAELAGLGGLLAGHLVAQYHWSFWLAMPAAVAASVAVGVVVGLPALRLRGLVLGVVTLALALGFDDFVFTLGPFKRGEFISRPSLLGWNLADDRATFAFCFGVLVVCAVLVANLKRSKTGRVLAAIRDAEVAARTSGVDVTRYKLLAFALSAGLAGLAGTLLDLTIGTVDKQGFTLLLSINLAAVVILMAPNYVASAFAGGVFLVWGGEFLSKLGVSPAYLNVVLGAGLILQLIAAPEGVVARAHHTLTGRVRPSGNRTEPAVLPS
ncbi:MAG: branched-chain amino acid ABC transporter permease [Acidimicrobiales bacterium]